MRRQIREHHGRREQDQQVLYAVLVVLWRRHPRRSCQAEHSEGVFPFNEVRPGVHECAVRGVELDLVEQEEWADPSRIGGNSIAFGEAFLVANRAIPETLSLR
ncbi:hypothetical protein [Microbacterium sp. KNMS]